MKILTKRSILPLFLLPIGWLAMGAGAPSAEAAPERVGNQWALLIGISEYPELGEAGQLPGAVPDAVAMRDVLVGRWGFDPDHVLLLLDGDATRAGIEDAFTRWLPSVAGPEDQVTIFFAGHGSQIWDETGETDDGLRQTIAPHDVRSDSPDFDIVDYQLGEWLRALPTRNVTFILDSCHSGRITTREATPFTRTRALPRNLESLDRPPAAATRSLPGPDQGRGMELDSGVLELAATQPHQVAVELLFPGEGGGEPFHGGAFTTYLVRQLWRAPGTASYEEVFQRVRDAMKESRFQQDPHLSEENPARQGPLFSMNGSSSGLAEATIPVVGGAGDRIELGAGAALGITPGSMLESPDGAKVVVESVTRDRTRARVVSGGVSLGDRLAVTAFHFQPAPLRVNVAGLDGELRQALTTHGWETGSIDFVLGENDLSEIYLRRGAEEVRVVGLDGAIRHRLELRNGVVDDMADVLRTEAAARRLASLDNPARPFRVEVSLAGGRTTFGIGEVVTFHARSERDGYLTLVDLGTDGTVTVLFPNPYDRDHRIRAGEEIIFPSRDMGSDIVAMPPLGLGTVRAFVTEHDLGLTVGDDFASGDLLLADEIIGAVVRSAGVAGESEDAILLRGWSTASLVYEIRP